MDSVRVMKVTIDWQVKREDMLKAWRIVFQISLSLIPYFLERGKHGLGMSSDYEYNVHTFDPMRNIHLYASELLKTLL